MAVTAEMRASGWIGDRPAPTEDIAATQARLMRSLPRSYRAFLAITDGWPVLSFDFGQVRPVAGVDWVATADPAILDALPYWRPLSPVHMAPMGLTWDRDLGRIMNSERRERLLATARESG